MSTKTDDVEPTEARPVHPYDRPLWQTSLRSILCRFLATSPIPLVSPFAIDLMELVPTSHFCDFTGYSDPVTKKKLLQAFSHRSSNYQPHYRRRHRMAPIHISSSNYRNGTLPPLVIPTLFCKPTMATALACNRHRVMGGAPRRVYYHVTLQGPSTLPSRGQPSPTPSGTNNSLFCMMHDTDTVVGFDHQLVTYRGKLWYEDDGIITDSSWDAVVEVVGNTLRDHRDIRPSPVGYYDPHNTDYHRGWRPCLLKTLFDCRLKRDVRKGGLKKGDLFDCVFVYEHREDDAICLEFCQRDKQRQRWVPQGFLLFVEHHIEWAS